MVATQLMEHTYTKNIVSILYEILTVACICSVQRSQYTKFVLLLDYNCTHSTWKVSYEASFNCYHALGNFFTAPLTVSRTAVTYASFLITVT